MTAYFLLTIGDSSLKTDYIFKKTIRLVRELLCSLLLFQAKSETQLKEMFILKC